MKRNYSNDYKGLRLNSPCALIVNYSIRNENRAERNENKAERNETSGTKGNDPRHPVPPGEGLCVRRDSGYPNIWFTALDEQLFQKPHPFKTPPGGLTS